MIDQRFPTFDLIPLDAPPAERRILRFNTLTAAQELYVEDRVARANFSSLQIGQREYGYVAIDDNKTLLEFYIDDAMIPHLRPITTQLVQQGRVCAILAQSFDPTLMFLGLSIGHQPKTKALLYRKIVNHSFFPRKEISTVQGSASDAELLSGLSDDFFDSCEEIASYIVEGGLFIYRINDEIVGAGVMKRVVRSQPAIDIGMLVAPRRRHQGIGTYIVQHLKNYCLSKGLNPICGCEIGNITSQRTLESAGFASLHQLVEFKAPASYDDDRDKAILAVSATTASL